MLIKRTTRSGANDLTSVYRPCTVDEVVGHDANKKIIGNGLKAGTLPHLMLFTGPAGCGKTTMARIVALGLNCESVESTTNEPCLACDSCIRIMSQNNLDVIEINVGQDGGKAAVAKVTENLMFAPFDFKYKVLIFDEAHELSKSAQDLLLKKIEDGFSHVYFIFCTNKPEKLGSAFISRTHIGNFHFDRLPADLMEKMLINICEFEGIEYNYQAIKLIIEWTNGIPRDAIGIIKKVIDGGSWDEQDVKGLLGSLVDEEDADIMAIGKAISKGSFKEAIKVLKVLKKKNVPEEAIRIATAGFFTNKLKWSKSYEEGDKISLILDEMTEPILYTGKPAHHSLVNKIYKSTRVIKKGV